MAGILFVGCAEVTVDATWAIEEAGGVGGGTVGVKVGISTEGPKGVNEAVAFGLGVMVGPAMIGMIGGEVYAGSQKEEGRNKEEERRAARHGYFFFQTTPRRGWKRKTNRKMAVAVSTMAEPETMFK